MILHRFVFAQIVFFCFHARSGISVDVFLFFHSDIPEEYRDAQGNFKMMPVPRHLGSLTRRRPPLVAVVGVSFRVGDSTFVRRNEASFAAPTC